MKLVKKIKQEEISVNEIDYDNDNLIIVSKRSGEPVIYYSKEYEQLSSLEALCFSDRSLQGNSYDDTKTIEDILDRSKDTHVFKSKDWKEALKWLIDNC